MRATVPAPPPTNSGGLMTGASPPRPYHPLSPTPHGIPDPDITVKNGGTGPTPGLSRRAHFGTFHALPMFGRRMRPFMASTRRMYGKLLFLPYAVTLYEPTWRNHGG